MKKLLIILTILGSMVVSPQSRQDTTYQVELTITACPLLSIFRHERYPGAKKNVSFGSGFFIRCLWHPGRLLSVGFLTGYAQISSDEFTVNSLLNNEPDRNASAQLTAIPLQVAVSMQKNNLEIGLGMGPYLMQSTIYYISTAHGRRFELGLTFFGSYYFPVSKDFYLGPELRVLYLSYRGIISLMPSILFRLEILKY